MDWLDPTLKLVTLPTRPFKALCPIPDDLEGTLPVEHLEPAALASRPLRRVAAADLPGLPPDASSGVPKSDPGLTDRLRALGYLAD